MLTGGHVGIIAGAVGFHTPFGPKAGGHTVVTLDVAGQCGHQEVNVLHTGLELHVGLQALHVVEAGDAAVSLQLKSGRQRHVKAGKLQLIHIALYASPERQRIVGPALPHGLGQVLHKECQVAPAQLSIHQQRHLAGGYRVGQRKGKVQLGIDVGAGSLHAETGQAKTVTLHGHRAGQFGDFQAALLLQGHLTDIQAEVGGAVTNAVDSNVQTGQVEVVVVEPGDCRHIVLVVREAAILPVNAAHGIGGGFQVDITFTCHQFTDVAADAHGVARGMEGHVGAENGSIVEAYLPWSLSNCSVFGNGVVHGDV